MIEFSRDKKTSVLICGDEKGMAARLGSARLLSLLACPCKSDRGFSSVGRKVF